MAYDISLHDVPAQAIRSIRGRVAPADLPAFLAGCFGELFAHDGAGAIVPVGHPFVLYHAFAPDAIDTEVAVPVAQLAPPRGRASSRTLEGCVVVRTVHVGPYEALSSAYDALTMWARDHGYAIAGPPLERYLTGVDEGVAPDAYRTEIEVPVTHAAAVVPAGT